MIKMQQLKKENCWLCGNQANSKEHRHKKTDVKRIFGNKFEGEPIIVKDSFQKRIQGPDSKLLKFENVLCQDCNNNRSQPFDRAYDLFINYVLENYDKILDTNILDFNEIIQDDTLEFKNNVLRYLTKIFCCRLAANNISIKPEIIQFLNYKKPINFLYFKFEVRPDIHAFLNRTGADEHEGYIYLSPLRYFLLENNRINLVYQFYNLQWLRIYTFYSEKMNNEIYLGYKKYNNSEKIQIEAKYLINPEKLFDKNIDIKPKEYKENKWIEEYLSTDIFKKY